MTENIWAEKPKPVWVPRGYYSKSKIKEDDLQMFITEEVDTWLEKLKTHYESKTCRTCKQFSYTQFRESYCKRDGYKTSAERTCSHWEDEG